MPKMKYLTTKYDFFFNLHPQPLLSESESRRVTQRKFNEKVISSLVLIFKSKNCVIPVVCVRTLGSVGSQTQLSLRCNFSNFSRDLYIMRAVLLLSTPKTT